MWEGWPTHHPSTPIRMTTTPRNTTKIYNPHFVALQGGDFLFYIWVLLIVMKSIDLIRRINELMLKADKIIEAKKIDNPFGSAVDYPMIIEFRTSSEGFLLNFFGEESVYYQKFISVKKARGVNGIGACKSVLAALKEDIEGGWLQSTKQLISAEIFTDFLEMAEHLLKEGYKDPAAVMIGSVLEEHLRQLCQKNNVDIVVVKGTDTIPKKADAMNIDLCKATVYNMLDQKQITSWLDLRNRAAHGKYTEYTKEQVDLMYQGVLNFIARVN
jgi:hypothetical protein